MTKPALPTGLYGIIDADCERDMQELLDAYIFGGTRVLQLRMKRRAVAEILPFGLHMREVCRQANCTFIVNDRADVAALLDADGVHLGQDDIPIEAARALLPNGLIGKSTHDDNQLWLAVNEGADYVAYGPVFPTKTKSNAAPVVGLKSLLQVAKTTSIPVVAVGGVKVDNIKQIVGTGVHAAAVISAVDNAWQPKDAVRSLVRAFLPPAKPVQSPISNLKQRN